MELIRNLQIGAMANEKGNLGVNPQQQNMAILGLKAMGNIQLGNGLTAVQRLEQLITNTLPKGFLQKEDTEIGKLKGQALDISEDALKAQKEIAKQHKDNLMIQKNRLPQNEQKEIPGLRQQIPTFANGGLVEDKIIQVKNGEMVINKESTAKHYDLLRKINADKFTARRESNREAFLAKRWRKSNWGNDDLAPESNWASNREVRRIHAEYARQEARERHLSPEVRRIRHENERLMKAGFSEEQITNNWRQFHPKNREHSMPMINGKHYVNEGGHIKFVEELNKTLSSVPHTFTHEHSHSEMTHRVIGESSLGQAIVNAVTEHINDLVNKRVNQSISPITGETNSQTYS